MKTFIFSILIISGLSTYAQTVTTTTINGSLKVNDSVNVSNNLQAAEIRSRGELIAKDVMRGESDIIVAGNASVGGNLSVTGTSHLQSGFLAPGMLIGDLTDNIKISMQTLSSGARILAFGFPGEVTELANKCIQPYNSSSLSIFNNRAGVVNTSSSNMLDFNNDGSNGSIDYGFNINQYTAFDPNNSAAQVRPALKLNGLCWGDVEIAKGGGFVSAGAWLEVGNPTRNGSITSNINSQAGRIAQRITSASSYPESTTNPPEQFNTQLFVNRSKIKALTVFNTSTNLNGDQTFVVYGSGKTQINAFTPADKYFIMSDVSNSASVKERFIIYGNGSTELNTSATDALTIKDGSINGNVNFKVKNTGHVFAREMQIMAPSMNFPDYVFDKDYKRLNLAELDAYITAQKHLPGFEKAEYYETNGIIASEMFVKQQEKIEELTLYLIELKKEIEELKKKVVGH